MPTYERCYKSINTLATQLINQYETNKPLAVVEIKIDFLFAYADKDEHGRPINDAITKNGVKALGLTRKTSLKERALDRGDAEIMLDGGYWRKATAEQQAALLDHELHHLQIKCDKHGNVKYDDLGRPQLELRKHDVEIGWFKAIADRHGNDSQERIQARVIMDNMGQYFWPDLAPTIEISTGGKSTGLMPLGAFSKVVATAMQP